MAQENPEISQITIGNTTYDIKDPVARQGGGGGGGSALTYDDGYIAIDYDKVS